MSGQCTKTNTTRCGTHTVKGWRCVFVCVCVSTRWRSVSTGRRQLATCPTRWYCPSARPATRLPCVTSFTSWTTATDNSCAPTDSLSVTVDHLLSTVDRIGNRCHEFRACLQSSPEYLLYHRSQSHYTLRWNKPSSAREEFLFLKSRYTNVLIIIIIIIIIIIVDVARSPDSHLPMADSGEDELRGWISSNLSGP